MRVLPDPEGRLTGQQVGSLAYDAKSKSLFFAYPNPSGAYFAEAKHDVFKLNPADGKVTATLEVGIPRALATGADGSVYVFDQAPAVTPGNPATTSAACCASRPRARWKSSPRSRMQRKESSAKRIQYLDRDRHRLCLL